MPSEEFAKDANELLLRVDLAKEQSGGEPNVDFFKRKTLPLTPVPPHTPEYFNRFYRWDGTPQYYSWYG
jgi:hypothetical protein